MAPLPWRPSGIPGHRPRLSPGGVLRSFKMAGDNTETRPFDFERPWLQRFAPGVVLNHRYLLDNEVGRGGMGVVYRATDLELRREVALKIVPEGVSSDEARQRLLHEARAAATLNHPHIVTVHDIGEDRGVPFFVMEFIAGPNLGQVKISDLSDIVEIACQICDALEHAHAHSIVHRDLKPENVLLVGGAASRTVKLADLGLAVPVRGSRMAQTGAIVGTVDYMAPEQAMGEPVDGRTDLYALGVVLYELTTGRPPFSGDHPLAIISQHVNAPVVPPRAMRPDLPRQIEAVILKLLAKSPEQRYATAGEVRNALRQALEVGVAPRDEHAVAVAVLDALSRGRLIGRVDELAEAREFWRRAREGRSHCVLLSGEPGAGKTRLGREIIVQAALEGGVVLAGACYEYEATTPYLPFAEAFRSWVRDQKDSDKLHEVCGGLAPQLARLAPEIETRLGPFPDRPALAPHEERLLFFDAVVQAFRKLAAVRGLLFYVDDLHWADNSTLWLFGHLLRHLRDERVLLVASYRETELDRAHPLSKALVDWNRDRLITRIVLRRLGPTETRAQLSALLGQEVAADFAAAVHRETEGNPFFVEEVLKALIEQGSVRRESGHWTCSAVRHLQIPQSMKAAIGRRLDRMSPEGNEILRRAAVLGKTFDFKELLAAAGDGREDALLDALDEAVAAQLLVAGRDEAFAFTHDKIREVLYEELNPIRRRRFHLRTAEGLERYRERAPVAVEKLAHHFIAAGEHNRGLGYAKEAAAEAERLFAYDEAIAAYGRALECAETLGHRDEQAALEEAIGSAYISSGDLIPAIGHFERALALTTDPGDRARLHCLAASSLVARGDVRGLEYVQEALAVLDPATHPIETANALAIEGRFHHLAGRHRKAIEYLERAATLASAKPGGPKVTGVAASTLTHIYAYLAGAHQHLGLFADADRWAQHAIAFGIDHGVPLAQALGYEFLGEDAMHTGAWQKGLEYADREREIAGRLHSRERQAWTNLVGGVCSMYLGEAKRSESEFRNGLALANAIGERRLATLLAGNLAILLADLGRTDEALATGLEALDWADTLGLLYMRTEARRALGHVRFRRGELDEALRLCDEVLALTAGREPKVSRLSLGPLHIELLVAAGRLDAAREQLHTYELLVRECQSPRFDREVLRLRAGVQDAKC